MGLRKFFGKANSLRLRMGLGTARARLAQAEKDLKKINEQLRPLMERRAEAFANYEKAEKGTPERDKARAAAQQADVAYSRIALKQNRLTVRKVRLDEKFRKT